MELSNNYVGQTIVHPSLGELKITGQQGLYFNTASVVVPMMMFFQTKCRFKDDDTQNKFLSEPNMEQMIKDTYKTAVKPEVYKTYLSFYRTTMKLAYEGAMQHYIE